MTSSEPHGGESVPQREFRLDLLAALALGLAVTIFYAVWPAHDTRNWDALTAAGCLVFWDRLSWAQVLHFAHPLVFPVTRLFQFGLPGLSPLMVVTVTESAFMGLCASLLFGAGRASGAGRWFACFPGLILALSTGLWVVTTSGEEKPMGTAIALLFTVLYLSSAGAFAEHYPRVPETRLTALCLAGLLWLALMAHLVNGLLFGLVGLTAGVRWLQGQKEQLVSAGIILGLGVPASLLSYVALGLWVHHQPGLAALPAWLTQYHYDTYFQPDQSVVTALTQSGLGIWQALLGEPLPSAGWALLLVAVCLLVELVALIALVRRGRLGAAVGLAGFLAVSFVNSMYFAALIPESWLEIIVFALLPASMAMASPKAGLNVGGVLAGLLVLVFAGRHLPVMTASWHGQNHHQNLARLVAREADGGIVLHNYLYLQHYLLMEQGIEPILWGNLYAVGRPRLEVMGAYQTPYRSVFYDTKATIDSVNLKLEQGTPVFALGLEVPQETATLRSLAELGPHKTLVVSTPPRNGQAGEVRFRLWKVLRLKPG
ncbi:MAG: hypothetical protein AB7S38_37525 [Vulcanimicrobiota bacterium]